MYRRNSLWDSKALHMLPFGLKCRQMVRDDLWLSPVVRCAKSELLLIETALVTENWHLPIDRTFHCFSSLRSFGNTYRYVLSTSSEPCSMLGQVYHGKYQANICWALYLLEHTPFCLLLHGQGNNLLVSPS